MKRWTTLLIIIDIQMETIIRYHLIPTQNSIIKNLQTVNAGEDVEKRYLFALLVDM